MSKIKINQNAFKGKKKWIRHKVEAGSNVYRILPPFGDEEITNCYPFKRWSTVWLTNQETGRQLPIATPFTTGQDCPVREYTDKLIEFIAEQRTALLASGSSEDEVSEKLHELNQISWKTAVKTTYAYNAVNTSGEVGILELKATAHKGMKTAMSQYILDYNQDPTSVGSDNDDSGVWMNVRRDGTGKQTEYGVEFNQTKEKDDNGRLIKLDDRSALPAAVTNNLEDLCYDLFKIYKQKNYAETLQALKYHLHSQRDVCPEAILPGYEYDPADDIKEVAKESTKSVTKGTGDVTVNLGGDDLPDDDQKVVDVKPTANGISVASNIDSMIDDIMA